MNRILLTLSSLLLGANIFAQQHLQDTAFQTAAVDQAKKISVAANAPQAGLYNGSAFLEPPQTSLEQFPYYLYNDWLTGDVHYDGILYEQVPLMYDIYSDYLITEIPANGTMIRLVNEKIQYFIIQGLVFIKMNHPDLVSGFFARLYDGPTQVLARFEKTKQEKIESAKLNLEYEPRTRYFILKNGKYFNVRRKSDVLKVLADRKGELKQFAKKERLRFSTQKAESITKLARFYDSITR